MSIFHSNRTTPRGAIGRSKEEPTLLVWMHGTIWFGRKKPRTGAHTRADTQLEVLGPSGFSFSHHGPTTRPSVERTAEKEFMLSDRV